MSEQSNTSSPTNQEESTMSKRVVIYGFYSHESLGDEMFRIVFAKMLPSCELIFTDQLNDKVLNKADVLIVGGGSFLETKIDIPSNLTMPLAYVGVGSETDIHSTQQTLLKRAKFVAVRSDTKLPIISGLNPDTFVIPDLVYSLFDKSYPAIRTPAINRSILWVPNINCVPKYDDAHYKHTGWQRFKEQLAETFDSLITDGYSIDYLPMSSHPQQLDEYAVVEVKNLMRKGHLLSLRRPPFPNYPLSDTDIRPLVQTFSSYGTIISQRFHGLILSELARRSYLSIFHHDKLAKTSLNEGTFRSYYACSKATLLDDFNQLQATKLNAEPAIDWHSFEDLKERLSKLLE
jgi:Polysaccharide pyruvyl transferase